MSERADAVAQLLREAAAALVLPRFRHLQPGDIESKGDKGGVEDLVTVVDREVERFLTDRLHALLPAPVIGEEATHRDAAVLSALDTDGWVWLVDPIDGTRRFAEGDDRFGLMVALVRDGETVGAWILLPARETMLVAERGSGTRLNGERVHVAAAPATTVPMPPRGMLVSRFMPEAMRATALRRAGQTLRETPISGCAAVDYTAVLQGELDFMVYYRLLPWDHAAPALMLTEAGGLVEHASGRPYSPRATHQPTIACRTHAVCDLVARCFAPS